MASLRLFGFETRRLKLLWWRFAAANVRMVRLCGG